MVPKTGGTLSLNAELLSRGQKTSTTPWLKVDALRLYSSVGH